MFELEKQIVEWRKNLERHHTARKESLDELESHLRDQLVRLQGIGLSEAEQFQIATGRLGEVQAIKQEFAKAEQERFWSGWKTPAALKFLGVWFMLMGLSGLSFLPTLWEIGFSTTLFRALLCVAFCALQVVIGVGLLRRANFWRYGALVWAALFLVGSLASGHPFSGMVPHVIFHRIQIAGDFFSQMEPLNHWQLELFTKSADFRHVTDFLSPAFLIWGAWLLTRRRVREAFNHEQPAEIA